LPITRVIIDFDDTVSEIKRDSYDIHSIVLSIVLANKIYLN